MLELNFEGSQEKKEINNAYKTMCQGEVKKQILVCESVDKLSKDFEMITVTHIKPLVKAFGMFDKLAASGPGTPTWNEAVAFLKNFRVIL